MIAFQALTQVRPCHRRNFAMASLRVLIVLLVSQHSAFVALADEASDAKQFADQILPTFVKHCRECHGEESPEATFQIEDLSTDFANKAILKKWRVVLEKLNAGEMPPNE